MDEHLVTRTDRGGVATVQLNRPARRNAIIAPLLDRLAEHIEAISIDDSIDAVVLCGAGGAFCSGLDLDAYNADPPPDWIGTARDSLLRAHVAIAACPAPVVVALERYAINGGAAFALAGDYVIAGEGAWLQVGEVRIGMMAPMNLAWLTARYPAATVLRVVLRGDRLDAAAMYGMTIADEVVADQVVLERAHEVAADLAGFPGGSTRTMKVATLAMITGVPAATSHQERMRAIGEWFEDAIELSDSLGGNARPRRMSES